ncbi:likely protein kinase [Pseudozyma hubeiensis SY62]|uniref:non-specific serine/threonine protein kinase n=1 Tax=Pseudozyma hubeiensis (strain SY62) TaxID=1305764 RepID=R9NWF5_PSEHS|nr:likely protein kinase [Pseudozyma hubeiensis SY62]GAC92844.1 likely protein kinase [Pseudozyma hubeiensis SY62]
MSAPTPLHPAPASAPTSATSSAAVSRVSSIRSNAPPPSSASTTRIRKGLLSRTGSEAEDRMSRAASASHPQLTTDDDDDEYMISDSGPMPRRFASQNRAPPGTASSSRQSSNSSLPHTNWANRPGATSHPLNASSASIASGNRSGSGDASEGAASSVGGVSLGRAMSVSSVSSVNSTSSLEAVPFREAPLGNVRLGFGGAAARFAARNARADPYGSLSLAAQQPTASQSAAANVAGQDVDSQMAAADSREAHHYATNDPSSSSAFASAPSTQATTLGTSLPNSERHKGVPKPMTDAWMYRVGPGMRTNRPPRPTSIATSELPELQLDESQLASSPAKRSREVIRQKFVKGAGRLGIKTNIVTSLAPSPAEHYDVYNPLDSSEDEINLISPTRTPLPRSSSYFSSGPHSANTAPATPLHALLTPVPADFRTSSVTNAPLFVPKFAEDLPSARLHPEAAGHAGSAFGHDDTRLASSADAGHAPSLPPLGYGAQAGSISSDLAPYLTNLTSGQIDGASHTRRGSAATHKPVLMRNESSNDAFDRTASPGLLVRDPSAVDAPDAEPALYTLSAPGLSLATQRSPHVELAATPYNEARASPHPTPAELVRMEAQAGIASLPDSPSEPSPVPASYSPVVEDEDVTATNTLARTKIRRPSSATGSEAGASSSRRPDSLQRPRMWSNAKRPAVLRARTSESSISKGRRSQSSDRRAYSPSGQSPIEGLVQESPFDRPGTHSKNSSSSTAIGIGELGMRAPPHVAVIPEDDDGVHGTGSGYGRIDTSDRVAMPAPGELASNSPGMTPGRELHEGMALSPPSAATLPFVMRTTPGPRSASPASQLARSPETIRVGPARITDSIYARSPASISHIQSPRLLPTSASSVPDRTNTPSPRTFSARGPNDFHFGDTLGEGSYSTVLEAWDLLSGPNPKEPGVVDPTATSAASAMVGSESHRRRRRRLDLTGRKAYAIKVLDKVHILKQNKQKYVAIEKEALSRMIRHPGVVTLFWTFQDRESLYFVLELASNGELLNFIRKRGSFDVESARFYAAMLVDTLEAMHVAGVVHRDVKPENVLLDGKMRVKITDFGSAKIVHPAGETEKVESEVKEEEEGGRKRAASFVGTAEYVSPELLVEKAQPAGKPADWWAFGCVLFQMLAGRPPFKGVNEYQTLQKVKKREFEFPEGFEEDAKDLIDRVLALDPAERLTAAEIKAHRFFGSIDWKKLWEQDAPEIRTGLVQPLPTARGEERTSDFSFDEGFGSSDESQAYNGDTQSIDRDNAEGADVGEGTGMDDADDSDLSDASSQNQATSWGKRQSGLQRLTDGFQSRFMSTGSSSPQANGRRRFSNMSIDASRPAIAETNTEPSAVPRPMRPFSRSMQTMSTNHHHSPSPNSTTRIQPSSSSSTPAAAAATASTTGTTSVGLQHSWAALLLPKEVMLYSLPVAQKKTGTGKMFTKRRQLVLTDFPRLLCVKETATALKVKSEVILAIRASRTNGVTSGDAGGGQGDFERLSGGRHSTAQPDDEVREDEAGHQQQQQQQQQQQVIPNLLTGLEWRGGRTFSVRVVNGRSFVYETLGGGDAGALRGCLPKSETGKDRILRLQPSRA